MNRAFRFGAILALLAISPLFSLSTTAAAIEPGDLIVANEYYGLFHVSGQTGVETEIPTPGLALNTFAGVVVDPSR